MLYKNLPEKELNKVLCVRSFLDRIAAVVFYLKKDKESAKAVFQEGEILSVPVIALLLPAWRI